MSSSKDRLVKQSETEENKAFPQIKKSAGRSRSTAKSIVRALSNSPIYKSAGIGDATLFKVEVNGDPDIIKSYFMISCGSMVVSQAQVNFQSILIFILLMAHGQHAEDS
jgi:hypothetical protein